MCLDIADVVRDELTILRKKIEELRLLYLTFKWNKGILHSYRAECVPIVIWKTNCGSI